MKAASLHFFIENEYSIKPLALTKYGVTGWPKFVSMPMNNEVITIVIYLG